MTNTTADVTVYENEKWLYPIWKGDTVYAETAFILKNALGEIRPKRLAYPIQKIISVRSFDLKTVYEEGKDYEINEYGELQVLPGGKIPYLNWNEYRFSEFVQDDVHMPSADALGAECVWGNGYDYFKGWVDNVTIYNFAMTEEQSAAYWQKGKVVVKDMAGSIISSIDSVPHFEQEGVYVDEKGLNDKLTATQFVNRLKPATVNALLDDGETTIPVSVTWKTVKLESDGKYYAIGEVDATNLGYATTLTGVTEVRQEVAVEKRDRKIVIDEAIENGTVVSDKAAAKLGESVVITVTANDGYELKELTVGGEAVTVNEDGTYTFTIKGNSDVEISATFAEKAKEEKKSGCKSSVIASSAMLAAAGIAVCAALKKKRG